MDKKNNIKEYIKNKIKENYYRPGDKILSKAQITGYFKVSGNTAQTALAELIIEGVLEGRRGSGTYVKDINRKKYILISTQETTFTNDKKINNKNIITLLQKKLHDAGYISYINLEKNFNTYPNWQSQPSISEQYLNNLDDICLFISFGGHNKLCNHFAKNNIPVLCFSSDLSLPYPGVFTDFTDFYYKLINLFLKYIKSNNIYIFGYRYQYCSENKISDFFDFAKEYLDYKYNLFNIDISEKNNVITEYIRNILTNAPHIPECIVFLDDTIYKNALPLFSAYDYIFKNTKIITLSNGNEFYPPDYNICRLEYNPEQCAKGLFDLAIKYISENKTLTPRINFTSKVINEDKLK